MAINEPSVNWEKRIEEYVKWIRANQERFWAVTGTVLLVVLFLGLLVHRKQKESNEAWLQLGVIQSQLSQGNFAEVRKGIETWERRFSNSSAGSYEKFIKGDLAYRTSDYVQASQVYGQVAQSGRPDLIRPLALAGQIASEEMAGHIPESQALAQTFLDKYPDHFLAATIYLAQARLAEIKGDTAAAVAIYERIALLFPQSPWVNWAKAKSQTLPKK